MCHFVLSHVTFCNKSCAILSNVVCLVAVMCYFVPCCVSCCSHVLFCPMLCVLLQSCAILSHVVCLVAVCELKNPSMSAFLAGLEACGWLKHIQAVLETSVFIAKVPIVAYQLVPLCSRWLCWLLTGSAFNWQPLYPLVVDYLVS